MKRLAVCLVVIVVTAVTSDLSALPTAKPLRPANADASCGRGDPIVSCSKDCPTQFCTEGFGGANGAYLEGAGLEGTRFELASGTSDPIFPPKPGMVLTDAANCESPPLQLTIVGCEPGTTARACQVLFKGGPKDGICGMPEKHKVGVAIVEGYWKKDGAWQNGKQKVVTVACNADASPNEAQSLAADGSVSRCVKDNRFAPKGKNVALTACIRMERADYCGDGQSHTYTGTNIDVYTPKDPPDRDGQIDSDPKRWDDCADGRCFEATWSKDGAMCVGHSRWTDIPFDPSKCGDVKFPVEIPAKNKQNGNGTIYCRESAPSSKDFITRSRQRTCGQTTQNCSSEDSLDTDCPGCSADKDSKRAPKKPGKPAPKTP